MTSILFHCDQGPREKIEDAAAALEIRRLLSPRMAATLLLVCDGVGGHAHGEVASALAIEQISAYLSAFFASFSPVEDEPQFSPDATADALRRALVHANRVIVDHAADDSALRGMATTAVAGLIVDGLLFIAWAGDSRCYLFSRGVLERVTSDHSEVEELIAANVITREEAAFHPSAHTITRYLGQRVGFEPELIIRRIRPGDSILICTDGLTDVLSDAAIEAHLSAAEHGEIPSEDLAHALVRSALKAGTTDNVTVLVGRLIRSSASATETLTGAYPTELARTIRHLSLETTNA